MHFSAKGVNVGQNDLFVEGDGEKITVNALLNTEGDMDIKEV